MHLQASNFAVTQSATTAVPQILVNTVWKRLCGRAWWHKRRMVDMKLSSWYLLIHTSEIWRPDRQKSWVLAQAGRRTVDMKISSRYILVFVIPWICWFMRRWTAQEVFSSCSSCTDMTFLDDDAHHPIRKTSDHLQDEAQDMSPNSLFSVGILPPRWRYCCDYNLTNPMRATY